MSPKLRLLPVPLQALWVKRGTSPTHRRPCPRYSWACPLQMRFPKQGLRSRENPGILSPPHSGTGRCVTSLCKSHPILPTTQHWGQIRLYSLVSVLPLLYHWGLGQRRHFLPLFALAARKLKATLHVQSHQPSRLRFLGQLASLLFTGLLDLPRFG